MVNGMSKCYIQFDELTSYITNIIANSDNSFWKNKLLASDSIRLHIAVMVQPYLSRVLDGEKTIESRYSVNMVAPFGKVKTGDIVLLKKSGGDIVALFEAGKIRYFKLTDSSDLWRIRSKYNDRLVIEDWFWETKKESRFATLIDINELFVLPRFKINKRNRAAWMTLGFLNRQE